MCHHAKINAISLSGTLRGGPSHICVVIVCPSALGSAGAMSRICCPPDVACPWRGCSFFTLTVPDIFPVFLERKHHWTCEDTDRLAGLKKIQFSVPVLYIVTAGSDAPLPLPAETNYVRVKKRRKKKKKNTRIKINKMTA